MGQLTNLYVSSSYQGLLKMTDSATGVTGTLQTVQTGDGTNTPLQISQTQVNISGSLTVNGAPISINTGSLVTTSSFNAYTSSVDSHLAGLDAATGSLQLQINSKLDSSSFNSYTSSNDSKVNSLISQTGSYVTETESGSFLITGSVAGDTLTFTKGNGSQFSLQVVVATGSLPAGVVSGSAQVAAFGYATTSSVTSLSSSIATTDLSQNNRLGSLETTTGSLQNQINSKLNSSSFNSYTSSNDGRVNSLESKTGSYATTGSNVFKASQTISGSLDVTGTVTATSASFQYVNTVYETASVIYSSGSNQFGDASNDTQTLWGTVNLPSGPLSVTGSVIATNFTGSLQGTASYATNALSASYAPTVLPNGLVSGSSQISYTGITNVPSGIVSGSQQVTDLGFATTGSVNQKLDTGSFNSYTSSNDGKVNALIAATGSYVTETESGSFMTTGSVAGNVLTFTKGNGTTFNLTVDTGSNSNRNGLITTGSIAGTQAITGSLIVSGSEGITGSLNVSGSANFVGPVGFNLLQPDNFKQNLTLLGGINHFTSSTILNNYLNSITTSLNNNDNNFVLPPGAGISSAFGLGILTGSVFISGSNNLILNLGSNVAASQGRKQIYGSGNIGITAPQINTSSLTVPSITNNYNAGGLVLTLTTGSNAGNNAHTFGSNINLSSITWNHPSASIGAGASSTVSSNINVGTLNSITIGPTILTTPALLQNNIISNISLGLNHNSSSIQFNQNIVGGNSFTINNRYYTTGSNNFLAAASNIIGGQTIVVYAAGAPATNVSRTLVGNLIGGQTVNISLEQNNTDLGGLRSSIVYGQGLNVTGSHSAATTTQQGAAFFGRWNGQDNGLPDSARTVFAVGTGTADGTRRTGLYVTSGSLVGVSGSLDVKGPSTFTGSLDVSGSVTIANAGDLSMYGHTMFNVGTFYDTTTQSGSANVSQSISYNTTDITKGVSVVSGTRLTVANAGTYNIQFSAQIDRVAGSGTDTAYIWLKKNGNNVVGSAGAITISGGATAAKTISSWNYVVDSAANDYYELVWQSTDTNIQLIAAAASGNIPSIPSIITTVTQVR
jgi:hypothetical protein